MGQENDFTWNIYGKQVLAAIKHSEDKINQIERKIDSNQRELLQELNSFREANARIRIDMASMHGQFEKEKETMAGYFAKELAVMKTKMSHRVIVTNAITGIASAIGIAILAIFK